MWKLTILELCCKTAKDDIQISAIIVYNISFKFLIKVVNTFYGTMPAQLEKENSTRQDSGLSE